LVQKFFGEEKYIVGRARFELAKA